MTPSRTSEDNRPRPDDNTIDDLVKGVAFTADGLVPVIAQDHASGDVLMMAWMNADAIRETLRTGRVCYWSRSRKSLWRKGETSGQIQRLVRFMIDCDADTILLHVEQDGVACHTGRRSCFFNEVTDNGLTVNQSVAIDPKALYAKGAPDG